MERRIVNPWTWQDQFGFVQAHEVTGHQRILYCAGQTSMDAEGNPLHEGDMHAQLHQALDNLETVLAEAGYTLADVVRLNAYPTDVDQSLHPGHASRDVGMPTGRRNDGRGRRRSDGRDAG